MPVDRLDQSRAPRQRVHGTDAAVGDATPAVADLVADVACGEHRPLATLDVTFVEPALDSALALGQLPAYLGLHSKSLSCRGECERRYSSDTAERPRISSFFNFLSPQLPGEFACSRFSSTPGS